MHVSRTILVCLATVGQPDKTETDPLVIDARRILNTILESARTNRSDNNDELTSRYLRAAAAAASKLPEKRAVPAFALALGVALDRSEQMRKNIVVRSTWTQVESDSERKHRLAILGTPTIHARQDLAQHFGVSMALAAILGATKAEMAGLLKELLDAEEGGSGFSFADHAANLSGIELIRWLTEKPTRLANLAKQFDIGDFVLAPKGLPEGLSRAEFEKRFGNARDVRYRSMRDDMVNKIKKLPGYKKE